MIDGNNCLAKPFDLQIGYVHFHLLLLEENNVALLSFDPWVVVLTNSQQQQSLRRMLGSMWTGRPGVAGLSYLETSQMICGGLPINSVPTIFELRPPVADALRCVRN